MTQGKKVILNTMATYGRSIVAIALGLFSTRWVVKGLGKEDFGLYSLVGATIAMMTVFNSILSASISRYYAYELGVGRKQSDSAASDNMTKWFNSAIFLHIALALLVIAIGYPLGITAIKNWLVIPEERVSSCVIVFHLALASSVVAIVSAPYIAMFHATQNILEQSLWGVAMTVGVCLSAYATTIYNGDRMRLYSVLYVGAAIVVSLCMVIRSRHRFPVCRIRFAYFFDKVRIQSLLSFAGWQTYAAIGDMIRAQGNAFVINKGWGSIINASYAISNQVSGQAGALSNALQNAMLPAIASKAGEGAKESVMIYAEASNKIAALLIAVFTIPLSMEIGYVLRLWLGDAPDYSGMLCVCTLAMIFIDRLSGGSVMAIVANGKVGAYQFCSGSVAILSVLFVLAGVYMDYSPVVIGISFILLNIVKTILRLIFARRLMGFSIRYWVLRVMSPVCIVCGIVVLICYGVRLSLDESFLRVVASSFASVVFLSIFSWLFVFNSTERALVSDILCFVYRKLR